MRHDEEDILTDKSVAERALEPIYVPLDEVAARYRREFPDVLRDDVVNDAALTVFERALDAGMSPHEAMPFAGRTARAMAKDLHRAHSQNVAQDDAAARSAIIADIAAQRGQGGLK